MKSDKTSVVVLNDSLCQSLTKNGDIKKDIMAYSIKDRLEAEGYKDVTAIDCGSLSLNKQHNITEFLKNNLSLAEIKATQRESVLAARNNIITKIGIPKWQADVYKILPGDKDIRISDTIKDSKNSGVVLSCTANDLMSSVWVSPVSYALGKIKCSVPGLSSNAIKRTKVLMDYEKLRNNVIDGIKINIEQVLGINSNAKICAMGIYRPNITPEVFDGLFSKINEKLETAVKSYRQSYIDISDIKSRTFDFHPTNENFILMSNRVAEELINRFKENDQNIDINNFEYSNLGIDGALKDLQHLYIKEKQMIYEFIKYLVVNEPNKKAVLQFMKDYIEGRPNEIKNHYQIYSRAKSLVKTKN